MEYEAGDRGEEQRLLGPSAIPCGKGCSSEWGGMEELDGVGPWLGLS